jgi:hypothetical protein
MSDTRYVFRAMRQRPGFAMYHGAALSQIAEHPAFTAFNAFKNNSGKSRSAFRINDGIGIYVNMQARPKARTTSIRSLSNCNTWKNSPSCVRSAARFRGVGLDRGQGNLRPLAR